MAQTETQKTIFTIIALIAIIFLVWKLASVILLLLTALMLAAALNPIVIRLSKKMPLALASALVVLILFVPLIALAFAVLPGIIDQVPEIIGRVNTAFRTSVYFPQLQNLDLSNLAQKSGEYILHSTGKITGIVASFITLFVLTAYLIIDAKSLRKLLLDLIPRKQHEKVNNFLDEIAAINGHYIRSNLLISLICSLVIFVGLVLLGVPYAAALAAFAGILDLLPLVGGLIAAIPAVILAFTISPTIGLLTVTLFLIYQQIENNFLAPKIYNKALDLSPTLSLVSVLIGASLYGVAGAFISLPIAASVPAMIKYFRNED